VDAYKGVVEDHRKRLFDHEATLRRAPLEETPGDWGRSGPRTAGDLQRSASAAQERARSLSGRGRFGFRRIEMSEDRRWTAENWAAGANPRAVVQALEASASTGSTHAPAACSSFRVYANLVRTEVTEDFDDKQIGTLRISRKLNSGDYFKYEVDYLNEVGGEVVETRFVTTGDPLHSLVGRWSYRARNTSGDQHQEYCTEGSIERIDEHRSDIVYYSGDRGEVRTLHSPGPVSPEWAVCDIVAVVHEAEGCEQPRSSAAVVVNVLDEMCKLKVGSRIAAIGRWQVHRSGAAADLYGYCVFGQANPPSYYWIDASARVVVFSTLFQTFVLRDGDGISEVVRGLRTRNRSETANRAYAAPGKPAQ